MAKAEFLCAVCGNGVQAVGRNRADANRLAKWHEAEGHLCAACTTQQHAAENAVAAEANQSAGLPSLTGSEKQVAWAETIRAQILRDLERIAPIVAAYGSVTQMRLASDDERDAILKRAREAADSIESPGRAPYEMWAREVLHEVESADFYAAMLEVVRRQTRASWWIDNRSTGYARLAQMLEAQIQERFAESRPVPADVAELASAAQEEALLKPAGDIRSAQIAEMSYVAPALRILMPEKNETFRLTVKEMGFKWAETKWERRIDFRAGDPIDRMAEIAHRLIAAGFMVRLHDDEARAKAISGDFQPEQMRWVVAAKGGAYDGWVKIVWPKSDDLYAPAKRILGARYHDGAIYAPPGSIEEVAEFAQTYGFSMSQTPTAMLEAHRVAIAHGAVITDPKSGPEALRVTEDGKPAKMQAPMNAEVDDELRDDH